jgi:hypothetical protein
MTAKTKTTKRKRGPAPKIYAGGQRLTIRKTITVTEWQARWIAEHLEEIRLQADKNYPVQ